MSGLHSPLTIKIRAFPVRGGAQFVLLLCLHPAVLEPYLDLSLAETQVVGDLDPTSPGQVTIEVELLWKIKK